MMKVLHAGAKLRDAVPSAFSGGRVIDIQTPAGKCSFLPLMPGSRGKLRLLFFPEAAAHKTCMIFKLLFKTRTTFKIAPIFYADFCR
ncbi:MAG: hypothetical protein II187_02810 [Treponema sp.]|nr:hypothetical protein [Treponema sp.]